MDARTRFANCEHCGSTLEIKRSGGAAFTEVVDRLERIDDRLARMERQQRWRTPRPGRRHPHDGPASIAAVIVFLIAAAFIAIVGIGMMKAHRDFGADWDRVNRQIESHRLR